MSRTMHTQVSRKQSLSGMQIRLHQRASLRMPHEAEKIVCACSDAALGGSGSRACLGHGPAVDAQPWPR